MDVLRYNTDSTPCAPNDIFSVATYNVSRVLKSRTVPNGVCLVAIIIEKQHNACCAQLATSLPPCTESDRVARCAKIPLHCVLTLALRSLCCHPFRVRAFAGWPGTWALFSWGAGADSEPRKIKLITTAVGEPRDATDAGGNEAPASDRRVVLHDGALKLVCADGSVLRVLELQPLNKNVMGAKAFANGLRGEEITWVELEPAETMAA